MSGDRPAVSVIVVSDYGGRTAEDWNYLRNTLGALGQQAFDELAEVILVDSTPAGQQMPPDLAGLVASLRVIGGTTETSRRFRPRCRPARRESPRSTRRERGKRGVHWAGHGRRAVDPRRRLGVAVMPSRVVIVGAGPAGLTAAHELLGRGVVPLVLERDHIVGGLARTEAYRGFHFDVGGHRFYTKVDEVQRLWEAMLGDDFLSVPRLSRIHYKDRFLRYPLEGWDVLTTLGPAESVRVLSSYVRARLRPSRREKTFEDWVANRFGQRLYQTFFKRYTEKVWGVSCDSISADWAAQRIKGLSLATAVRNALFGGNGVKSMVGEFRYPRLGPGMMWRRFQQEIERRGGEVRLEAEVVRFHRSGARITGVTVRQAGRTSFVAGDHFLSSMPITHLVAYIEGTPARVLAHAAHLQHRALVLVGLIVNRALLFPDNWIYVHTPEVRAGRIQNFKNWSSAMVPDPSKSGVGVEYFCSPGDELWCSSDAALIELAKGELMQLGLVRPDEVEDGVVYRHAMAYPVYAHGYATHLEAIRDFLATIENLQTIGRNGLHRYNNQDHSMLTAMLAVRNLFGESHDLWKVNTERSYAEEFVLEDPAASHPAP